MASWDPLKLLKKIRDKLDYYIEEKEQGRERRLSYNAAPSNSWSPDPTKEERKRRKSYQDRSRRHTEPEPDCLIIIGGYENDSRRVIRGDGSNRGRNSRSEGNLAGPRQSQEAVLNPGVPQRGPRRSDSVLVRRGREYNGNARLSREHHRHRSRSPGRPRESNEHAIQRQEDVLPLPMVPPNWTAEARSNEPFSPRARNQSSQLYPPSPRSPPKQPAVNWDAMLREKNLATEAKRRQDEERWKAAEERRRKEEEKAEKRRKVEEAEQKSKADRVKRENEERRLRAFGSPLDRHGSDQPRRAPASGGSGYHRRPDNRHVANLLQERPAFGEIDQQDKAAPLRKAPAKSHSSPMKQRENNLQKEPPVVAPLTTENLRAQETDLFEEDDDVDPLGRGLGDNTRTFLQGLRLPTILQSDLTPSLEDHEVEDRNENS
jgi:hypothetical protein